MRGPDLVGYAPRAVHWSQDGKRVYFDWKRAGEPERKEFGHYVVEVDGTELNKSGSDRSGQDKSGYRLLTEEEAKLAPPAFGELSPDKRYTVYTEDGNIYLYDHVHGKRRQVVATTEGASDPHFIPDSKSDSRQIVFERQNNLYQLSIDSHGGENSSSENSEIASLRQLTDIRKGSPPADAKSSSGVANTSQDVLKKTEAELFETVRERTKYEEEQIAKRKSREARKPFYLSASQSVNELSLSPDGAYVCVTVREGERSERRTVVPNYITASGYTEAIPGRGNVGDVQTHSRIAVIKVDTGAAKWVEFTPPPLVAPGVKSKDRHVDWINWQWSEDGKRAAVMARASDNKDLWVIAVDPATGKTTVLAQNHDDAWIGGTDTSTLGFLPDNKRVYYLSERDGFAHLYEASTDGGKPVQLTQGSFEVSRVRLSPDKLRFYFVSSEAGFAERDLYSIPVDGGTRTRITHLSAADEDTYSVSPDDKMLAIVRSTGNRPPELFLIPNRPDADAKQITNSPTKEWLSYPWIEPPIVSIKARDGATIYARLYKPAKWRRGGPAVLFVHGAGYLQNVHNWWSHYYREYMFHHLLMERGYLVLDADYRGSAGYGRDWRTGIYRHMGGKDLEDEVDAAHWLTTTYDVNPKRIGIYGGSYGGFLTLMAMFTTPDVFAAGAALRPVSDWAHYNHGYTSNILNEPQNDPDAYRRSSPIFFAEGLKGALLICHGMVDDNVHVQDTMRLAQRLIELRKENWELAVFPVESHSFTEASSWADEYKRILKLFDANLRR